MTLLQMIFSGFAALAVASATLVVSSNNPVRSALFLVLCFFACAGLWMFAHAEFLALVLVLVYVGAVMTLFLFVIMMLDIDRVTSGRRFVRYVPYGLFIVAVLVSLMLVAIRPENTAFNQLAQALQPEAYSNTQALGEVLYTEYALGFEVAAILLLVAIIAAIALAFRGPRNCKTQKPGQQMRVKKSDRLKIIKMESEQ